MKKIERKVHKIDASGKILGRLATEISIKLRGKHKPDFAYSIDIGDFVQVSNAGKMKVSDKKLEQKKYHSYSGYPGGLKTAQMKKVFAANAGDTLRRAVFQMLPDNRLRKNMIKRLTISN